LLITHELVLTDSDTQKFVAHSVKSFLTVEEKIIFLRARKKLLASVPKVMKKNCRGKAIQLHFGFWGKRGRKRTLYKTADSRMRAVKLFFFETQRIWDKLTQFIEKNYPEQYTQLVKMKQYWNCPYTWSLWHTMAYNLRLQSTSHKDNFDDKEGICIIIPIGDFLGGDITLEEFDLDFQCQFGDIFVLSSALYLHKNQPIIKGSRDSMVLFNSCECTLIYND
jgi:hypothetical protein